MFEVFTFTLTNFLAKIIFSRGYRGCTKKEKNSGAVREGVGGGGVILAIRIWKFRRVEGGGGLCKIPSMEGCAYFLKSTHFRYPAQ